jgi:hypothetical protein
MAVQTLFWGALAAACVSLALGAVGRLLNTHFWLTNPTWHELAQTWLLLAIALGVYRMGMQHPRQ